MRFLKEKNKNSKRGRPSEWTNEELRQKALNTKYQHHGKRLTPSLLEKETGVGRNTWSRRMKNFINELNNPILPEISHQDLNDSLLPSIDLIFQKHKVEHNNLKNELLDLEILLYDMYKELKEFKGKEEKFNQSITENELLREELIVQKKRAKHYEVLYNNIVLSSMYPHLQDKEGSPTNKFKIKEKLIDMDSDIFKNNDIEELNSYFPDTSSDIENDSDEPTPNKNMEKLLNDFDIEK